MEREVRWPLLAQRQLLKIYEYILLDSFQNAEKVKHDILLSTRKLTQYPEMYQRDKYRANNDGSFRAYEIHRIRIAYRIKEKEIVIVRVRHTSMEPKMY
jgi:plasmid stabilization system protein ParE